MKSRRKICVFTATRAEYGLLYWLIHEIKTDRDLTLQLIVSGMHLSQTYGNTYRIIIKDGFKIDEKVEMLLANDSPVAICKSLALGIIGIAEALDRLKPDILVLLGDRYETLAAAQAAMISRIPIAHIHGGESTEGLIDEAIRHSITKMSHLHFVTTDQYRMRVIQLGEMPSSVFNFGTPGLEYILRQPLLSREELSKSMDFDLSSPYFLVTYHPVTLSDKKPQLPFQELLKALDRFQDHKIIITKPNADTFGKEIIQAIEKYAASREARVRVFDNLGQRKYLSAMSYADAVVGNSSSGIIEAPFLKVPTVNIGERQRKRLKAESIIDCKENEYSIVLAIRKALSAGFKKNLDKIESVYGHGNTAIEVKNTLKKYKLKDILFKRFYDLQVPI